MTRDLGLLIVLLVLAVWLAAHDHRLTDGDPIVWDARVASSETDD